MQVRYRPLVVSLKGLAGLVYTDFCLTLKCMKQLVFLFVILPIFFPIFAFANSGIASPDYIATFNTPGFKDRKTTTIQDRLIELLNHAPAKSVVRVNMYDFDWMPLARAFIDASKRGVNIRFVFDGELKKLAKKDGSAVNTLTKELVCAEKPCFTYCSAVLGIKGSCRGIANNHNKLLLMSELNDGTKYVSVLSSSNWTDGQLNNANDLLEINNDKKLYDGLMDYWKATQKEKSKSPLVVVGEKALVYTFPNNSYDPVLELLKHVSCRLPDSKIRVAQSRFTNSRQKIAQRLKDLSNQGCDVKVIVRDEPDMNSPGDHVEPILGDLLINLPFHDEKGNDVVKNSIHPKIVLIDAAFDESNVKTQVVLAGSHNLNSTSLKYNDELLAQITDKTVYANYLAFWNKILFDAKDAGIIK